MLIGHASIDENKRVKGGISGDQTGKEVCTRQWYNKPWNYLLRCVDPEDAEKMARACESACDNNMIGYDQNQRNTLRTQAARFDYDISKINAPCECDCSSLMAVCAECAGIKIPYSGSNAPTTTTMKTAFMNTGMFKLITKPEYLSKTDLLKRGDILVSVGKHTVMVLEDGDKLKSSKYVVGNTYTTDNDLYIRMSPYGTKLKHSSLTLDAIKHSHFDDLGNAILDKGTRVTCLEVQKLDTSIWIRIPSGWICAENETKRYIK